MIGASCGAPPPDAPPTAAAAAPVAEATRGVEGTAAHGDHNPHHGGVVLMKGDLHYEVVLDSSGRAHHVYFSDALREALPASVASDVVLTIRHPAEERIAMQIDDTGESWIGSGRRVETPAAASARLAFAVDREPYWIDIPFTPAPTTTGR
jgi:hypothetical protein